MGCRIAWAQAIADGRAGRLRAKGRHSMRDEINYRAQVGYPRYFPPGRFYRHHDMPNPWPWAPNPLLQAPPILVVDTLRRHSPTVELSRTTTPAGSARPGGEMRWPTSN